MMRIPQRGLLFFLFLFPLCVIAYEPISFVKKTNKDGLSNNYVQTFLQDSHGFLWVGTYDGLNCYDGSTFRTYFNDQNNPHSLPDSKILCIFEDSRSNLWVGTKSGGLALYNKALDRFVNFSEQSFLRVSYIVEIRKNTLLLVTNNGFWEINTISLKFKKIQLESILGVSVLSGIHDVLKDKQGNFWFGYFEDGIVTFDSTYKVINRIPSFNISGVEIKEVHCLYEDSTGNVWCTLGNTSLVLFDAGKRNYSVVCSSFDKTGLPSVTDLWDIVAKDQAKLWIGTSTGGIIEYNISSRSSTRYVSNPYVDNTLNTNACVTLFNDNTGNIWIGTHGGGISLYSPFKNQIKHYQNLPGDTRSLSCNMVSSIYEDPRGIIWLATDGGGLNSFNPATKQFKRFDVASKTGSNAILDIEPNDSISFWLSFWDGGIALFSINDESILSFKNEGKPNDLSLNNVKATKRVDDKLYIATHGHGLNILDIKTKKFTNKVNSPRYTYKLDSMKWGNELLYDSRKRLWCATNTGLYLVHNDSIISFWNQRGINKSLTSNVINCIFEDSRHTIWIGTNKGLNMFNENTRNFERYTSKDGFPSEYICAILEDDDQNLWISTNKGILRFSLNDASTRVFDDDYGVQETEFYPRSAFKSSDGLLYFGGLQGFNVLNPTHLSSVSSQCNVLINSLEIFYEQTLPLAPNSPLSKVMLLTDTLVVSWHQSILSFGFISIDYGASSKKNFRYKLSGFDEHWHSLGSQQKVTFTKLIPGQYILDVQATDHNGSWQNSYDRLVLVVLPPWWMTWWFISIVLLAFVLSIISFIYWRTYLIRKKNEELEIIVAQRTTDLLDINARLEESHEELNLQKELLESNNIDLKRLNATKDRFFSIIAHDLKNPLSTLMSFSHMLVENFNQYDETKKIKFTKLIEDTSKNTYELLLNLLTWARSQSGDMRYQSVEISSEALVDEICESLKEMLEAKELSFKKNVFTDTLIRVDKNMMLTVFRNLAVNAIKYSPRGGTIYFIITEHDEHFISISIKDQGIGMSEDTREKLFKIEHKVQSMPGTESEKGTGLGLIVCQEFVEQNHGHIYVTSSPGKGSTFTVLVPKR